MWSRIIEVGFGVWMGLSPFVFKHPASNSALWIHDLAVGAAIIAFALLSFWHPTRKAHRLNLLVGCWLMAYAYYHGLGDAPPASQNHLALGFLLLMFAIIPNHASDPPRSWVEKSAASLR